MNMNMNKLEYAYSEIQFYWLIGWERETIFEVIWGRVPRNSWTFIRISRNWYKTATQLQWKTNKKLFVFYRMTIVVFSDILNISESE